MEGSAQQIDLEEGPRHKAKMIEVADFPFHPQCPQDSRTPLDDTICMILSTGCDI